MMIISRAASLCAATRPRLAVSALAGSVPVTWLAREFGTSRKFVGVVRDKARQVVEKAFAPTRELPSEVEFFPRVSESRVRRFALAVVLVAHGSYRQVVELLRDLFGVSVCVATIHNWMVQAAQRADALNRAQDLSGVRVGLHDEIFQGARPVLAGVDAASTYCYLLQGVDQRDADTWGVHLLDAAAQGLDPDYTIADAGTGLRAGQAAAWGDKPCHGDAFHIRQQCEAVANVLARLAKGCASRREALELAMTQARLDGDGRPLSQALCRARHAETQARELAMSGHWLAGSATTCCRLPALSCKNVASCSTSSSSNCGCAWRWPSSARPCWGSPACSTTSSLRSLNVTIPRCTGCARSAGCSARSRPRTRTGCAGITCTPGSAPAS